MLPSPQQAVWPRPFVPTSTTKVPVPPPADIARQVAQLHQEYAPDYAVTNRTGRLALVAKLRNEVTRASDPARRYAILSEMRDLSGADRDVAAVWSAIDMMEMWFVVESISERAAALEALGEPVGAAEAANMARMYYTLLRRAQHEGRFRAGAKLVKPAGEAAEAAGDTSTQERIAAVGDQLRELIPEEVAAEKAERALQRNVNDARANFEWGRFVFLMRNDYAAGLPLLTRGSNGAYKAAAEAELKQPKDPAGRKTAGDLWWDVQKQEQGAIQQKAMQRVAFWYGQARSGLNGEELAEVNARTREINTALAMAMTVRRPNPVKPVPEKSAPVIPEEDSPIVKTTPKPAAQPAQKPLDAEAVGKLVRAVLQNGGRVRLADSTSWIRNEYDLPGGSFVLLGLALDKDVVDDGTAKLIGRIPTLKELVLDSKGINDAAVHRLSDLTQLTRLELASSRITDRSITALNEMTALRSVVLQGEQLGGANLDALAKLPKLTSLEITGGKISEGTFQAVSKLENLEILTLRDGNYPSRAIDRLQSLSKLTTLTLRSRSVKDSVVSHLSKLPALRRLTLEGPIGGSKLGALAELADLDSLTIISTGIEEKDLAPLGQVTGLRRLTLKTQSLGNGALAALSNLTKLEVLEIQTAGAFNEAGLKHLDGMKRLSYVHLAGLQVSQQGYEKFLSVHPNASLSPGPDWGDRFKSWRDGKGGAPFGQRRQPGN